MMLERPRYLEQFANQSELRRQRIEAVGWRIAKFLAAIWFLTMATRTAVIATGLSNTEAAMAIIGLWVCWQNTRVVRE